MSKKWVDVSKIGEVASRGKLYTDALVGSLATTTQAAVVELDETKQDIITGGQGTVASFNSSGDLTKIPMWANENLFCNADFRNPKNQNGQTTYTSDSISTPVSCIDGWNLIGHGQLVLEDGYIRLIPDEDGEYVTMYQDIPLDWTRHIIGNPVTVSVFGTGPMVAYFSGYNPTNELEFTLGWPSLVVTGNTSLTGDSKCYTRTHEDFSQLNHGHFLRAKISALASTGEARYSVVKLERGRIGTLAYRTESNTWALNTVMPSYSDGREATVNGDPGKLAAFNGNGSLSSFEGTPGDLVAIAQDGTAVSIPPSSVVSTAVRVNKNLIPNWNFQNCLNTNWKSFYPDAGTEIKTCIDGWMIPNGSMQITDIHKVNYVLSSKENPDLAQTVLTTGALWNGRNGDGPMTLSFLVGNVLNGTVRASVAFENGSKYSTPVADSAMYGSSKGLLTVTVQNPGKGATIIIEHMGGTSLRFTPYAIKLEEGDISTLGYRNADNEWTLYEQSIGEIETWAATNKRIPVGKNLLANADFTRFVNPERKSLLDSNGAVPAWTVLNGAVFHADTSWHLIDSIEIIENENDDDVMAEQRISEIVSPLSVMTISALCTIGDNEVSPLFRVVGKTDSNVISTLAEFIPGQDGFGSSTFLVPEGISAIYVQICRNLEAVGVFSAHPLKLKLEYGNVQTITREVDVDQNLPAIASPNWRALFYGKEGYSGDNLFINSDFRNFIDLSGKSEHSYEAVTGSNASIHRLVASWLFATFASSGWSIRTKNIPDLPHGARVSVNISNHPLYHLLFITQRVSINRFRTYPYTLSLVYKTPPDQIRSGASLYFRYPPTDTRIISEEIPPTYGEWKIASLTYTFSEEMLETDANIEPGIYFDIPGEYTIDLASMKLEEGPIQTLAYYDYNGKLIINSPWTSFELEREKLEAIQTFRRSPGPIGHAIGASSNAIICMIPLSTPLRRTPASFNPAHLFIAPTYADPSLSGIVYLKDVIGLTLYDPYIYFEAHVDTAVAQKWYQLGVNTPDRTPLEINAF